MCTTLCSGGGTNKLLVITAWNVPSKFILNLYSDEVFACNQCSWDFSPTNFVSLSVQTNEAKFRSVHVTPVWILSTSPMSNARKSAIMEESDVLLILLREWLHVRRVKEVVNLFITWN